MKNQKSKKSETISIMENLEYVPHSVVIKSIAAPTESVNTIAFDAGETLKGQISSFPIFLQVLEGQAQVIIADRSYQIESGHSIIIPADSFIIIKANVRFKMLSTIIRSDYREFNLKVKLNLLGLSA